MYISYRMGTEKTNTRDLGFANEWAADSLEQRLYKMTLEAGYKFKEISHDSCGRDIVYECVEAGLRYHVDSSN